MKYLMMSVSILFLALALNACTSSQRQDVGIAGGAVIGGVAGNALTGGSAAGTVVGAAVGGVAGNELAK
ncbi:MAG TPA: glycine zipper 2TM domain-containing protein [Gammaproteobacteria bacterium]|nr:glycine zipper 2TM domain-containing protein [Gammaproteobacteria bacterium]